MPMEPMMSEPPMPKAVILSALDDMSVPELADLIRAAELKRGEKLEEAKLHLVTEFRAKASELGLSAEALISEVNEAKRVPKAPATKDTKLEAKFRGPNGEEWSGRGRLPSWLSKFESAGRKRDEFSILKTES